METCEHGETSLCGLCYAGMRKRVREMESFVDDLTEQRKRGEELYTKRLEHIAALERSLRMRERDVLWLLREGIPDAGQDLIDDDEAATDQRLLDFVRLARIEEDGSETP